MKFRALPLATLALVFAGCSDDPPAATTTPPEATCDLSQATPQVHDSLSGSETWASGVHEVPSTLLLSEAGATLTISPCSEVRLGKDASLSFEDGAKLVAVGTKTQPIRFVRLGATEAWANVFAWAPSSLSLAYATLEGGGGTLAREDGDYEGASLVGRSSDDVRSDGAASRSRRSERLERARRDDGECSLRRRLDGPLGDRRRLVPALHRRGQRDRAAGGHVHRQRHRRGAPPVGRRGGVGQRPLPDRRRHAARPRGALPGRRHRREHYEFDMQDYLFDLRGYIILENAVSSDLVERLNKAIDPFLDLEYGKWRGNVQRFDNNGDAGIELQNIVEGGAPFEELIDHPAWYASFTALLW